MNQQSDAFARIKPAKSGKKISLSEDNITKPEDFPTGLLLYDTHLFLLISFFLQ